MSNLRYRLKKIERIRKEQGAGNLLLIAYHAPNNEYIWTDDKTNKTYITADTDEISKFYENNHDEIIIFLCFVISNNIFLNHI